MVHFGKKSKLDLHIMYLSYRCYLRNRRKFQNQNWTCYLLVIFFTFFRTFLLSVRLTFYDTKSHLVSAKGQIECTLEMHISRREIGKREIGNREISRGKWGTGKSGKNQEKMPIFRAKITQKRLKIMPKLLPPWAYIIRDCMSSWISID